MTKTNIKHQLKKLNINEILFDIVIAVLLIGLKTIFIKNDLLEISETKNSEILIVTIFLFPVIIFVTLGNLVGSFWKHKSAVIFKLIAVFTIILVATAILIILDDYYEFVLNDGALVLFSISVIPALLFGLLSRTKNFSKAVKISGIILLIGVSIAITLFMLSERLYKDTFSIAVAIGILIIGFFVLIPIPLKIIKWSRANIKFSKLLINLFAIISALSFAIWYFISDNKIEQSFFILYWLAVLSYRLLLAFEPPTNKLNIAIGLIVLMISYLI